MIEADFINLNAYPFQKIYQTTDRDKSVTSLVMQRLLNSS